MKSPMRKPPVKAQTRTAMHPARNLGQFLHPSKGGAKAGGGMLKTLASYGK